MTTKRVTFTSVKGYLLDTVQGRDYLSRDFEFQGNVQAFWGIRVWILGPNEKEEIVQKYGNGKTGVKIVNLKRRSAVMVRVYVWKEGGNPVPLETFITEPLNAVRLDSSLWKIFYCTDSNYDSKRGVTVTSYRLEMLRTTAELKASHGHPFNASNILLLYKPRRQSQQAS